MHPNFYCLFIKGFGQSSSFEKAEVALVSNFLEKVWLKIVFSNSHHPPVFPVHRSHFTFWLCIKKRFRTSFILGKKRKFKKFCSCNALDHPLDGGLYSELLPRLWTPRPGVHSPGAGPRIIHLSIPKAQSRDSLVNWTKTVSFHLSH